MAPRKSIAPFQSVFRLQLKSHQDAVKATPKVFVPRKAHKKSRGGCQACKLKRIKCDELKPMCTRCSKMEISCRYVDSPPTTLDVSMDLSLVSPSSDMYSMSVDLVETDLNNVLSGEAAGQEFNFRTLQHFQSIVSLTLGCAGVRNVMQCFVANTAWSHPHLMHMVMAMSCAHQKRFVPGEQFRRRCAYAEATNWESGLQLYRHHLGQLELGQRTGDWDAEVATTFLQIMFTFALDDEIPLDSIDSTEDAFVHVIEPFNAIGGFKALFHISNGFDTSSRWGRVLSSTDNEDRTFTSAKAGIKGLPRLLVALCELDENSTPENNPYHKILRALTPLFFLQPSTDNFSTLFACLGRTWDEFRPLVLQRDPRGLLLISYWLALLKQVDQWWLTTRARTECMAIVSYLSSLHEPRINALLPFPTAFATTDAALMWQLLEHVVRDVIE